MNNKTLVAYFSCSGVTKAVAKTLSEVTNADLFEIVPKIAYTQADLNWMDKNSRSSVEMKNCDSRPEIANRVQNMSEYSTIFVGFPIWWYVAPTIINTFLESYDFTGKTVIPFCTSGGSGVGNSVKKLQNSTKGAIWFDGIKFSENVSKNKIADYVSDLGLNKE